ncbi:MAG: hypothetical protein ACI4RC_04705 [Oscillospiraceae bacterium]
MKYSKPAMEFNAFEVAEEVLLTASGSAAPDNGFGGSDLEDGSTIVL